MSKIAAIVGRPNVGKSTLFNRLIGSRKAIVDDFSGVTRDRHYGVCEWLNREFTVIDTGGYVTNSDDVFEAAIRDQVKIAMSEADILLFMVDAAVGVTDLDLNFAEVLRKGNKPVLMVVNKVDNNERLMEAAEFYSMGFDPLFTISSMTGSGTGELLEEIYKRLNLKEEPEAIPKEIVEEAAEDPHMEVETDEEGEEFEYPVWAEEDYEEEVEESPEDKEKKPYDGIPKVAVVGRPNVGKSSFVNALLGEDRNIVTPIAGTTRDTILTHYKAFGKEMHLVDTAGIRKKGKVHENIEFYSVMRSIKAIQNSDVVVLMLDATLGLEAQDMNLLFLALKNNKGIIILVNKWDLVEDKETNTIKKFEESIRAKTAPFTDFPILFISVLTKQRIFKAVEKIEMVYENMQRRVPTHKLNEFLLPLIQHQPPPATKGKYIRIKYATQLKTRSVIFTLFCNLPQYIKDPYKRFIENKLRESFNFEGVPIRIFFRKK